MVVIYLYDSYDEGDNDNEGYDDSYGGWWWWLMLGKICWNISNKDNNGDDK